MIRAMSPLPLMLLTLALAVSACSSGPAADTFAAKPERASQPVETASVERGALTARYAATAALQAEREATLVSEVPGTVLELLVEEGDSVRKGQVLARVDAERSRLQLREAEADLERRKNDVERGEKLLARQLIAANAHDQSTSDYAVRRAEVAIARVTVGKSEIRAPFDGVITRRWVKRGQLLADHASVFDIADFSDLRADLRVPERDAVALASGQPVSFTVDALGTRHFTAAIERVAPVVDRASGTVMVTVRIENRDRSLRPGLFARMDVTFLHVENAVLMPKSAVLGNSTSAFAFVVEGTTARRVPLRLGQESGARVQVLEGLEPGATVVITGQAALSDGALVEVLSASPAAIVQSPVAIATDKTRS